MEAEGPSKHDTEDSGISSLKLANFVQEMRLDEKIERSEHEAEEVSNGSKKAADKLWKSWSFEQNTEFLKVLKENYEFFAEQRMVHLDKHFFQMARSIMGKTKLMCRIRYQKLYRESGKNLDELIRKLSETVAEQKKGQKTMEVSLHEGAQKYQRKKRGVIAELIDDSPSQSSYFHQMDPNSVCYFLMSFPKKDEDKVKSVSPRECKTI